MRKFSSWAIDTEKELQKAASLQVPRTGHL